MIAYLDCSTGMTGDKFLGALIDAGLEPDAVEAAAEACGVTLRVEAGPVVRAGITAVGVTVHGADDVARDWSVISAAFRDADLPGRVRDRALEAFGELARVEAAIHDAPLERVHFHEIGAADTVADILGVALGIETLGIERLTCSPVALGGGTVDTSHGLLPVPAPATAALLEGMPIVGGPVEAELTTPTGAALLRTFADEFGPAPAMRVTRTGRGAAGLDTAVPNVGQLMIGEPA